MEVVTQKHHSAICKLIEDHSNHPPIFLNYHKPDKPQDIEPTENEFWLLKKLNSDVAAIIHVRKSNDGMGEFEIIVAPEFRSKGIASEFLSELIEYCNNKTSWNGLKAGVKKGNTASEKLLIKKGFNCVHKSHLGSDWKIEFNR
ncbi:MAG TPA: hypothetical protein DF712_12725 [Balneola sp.]|mgnify:FL=1|nr:hypothetical protein [Bacteroidota bacterium]MAB66525.1 hypothetical protein [Bacteroidota bacterium]HCT53309.1 hypothetical protein [Balneola sp.]|tara:strand:+ start:8145 stop:8576 length:432 start_codon:yes stop_codon:yes gene_type:complete